MERNAPCHCGSGKKHKKCCWGKDQGSPLGSIAKDTPAKSIFEIFNSDDILATVAGLTLMSVNHGKNFRLEQIVADVLVAYNRNRLKISIQELKSVLDAEYSSSYMEDEPVNLFTDRISFHGGDYIIFPGITESSSFLLSTLVRILFLQPQHDMPKPFLAKCYQATKLILELSNSMARELNLTRYQAGEVSKGRISIPEETRLRALKAAVVISDQEMVKLKGIFGISDKVLTAFLISEKDTSLAGHYGEESSLAARPIFKAENGYIIASPASLTYALVEYIRAESSHMGCDELLKTEFHNQIWYDLQLKLKALGFDYIEG